MLEAMLHGWRAQQKTRALQDTTIEPRERLVRALMDFANEYL
jgi:integrase/recombinase XerC